MRSQSRDRPARPPAAHRLIGLVDVERVNRRVTVGWLASSRNQGSVKNICTRLLIPAAIDDISSIGRRGGHAEPLSQGFSSRGECSWTATPSITSLDPEHSLKPCTPQVGVAEDRHITVGRSAGGRHLAVPHTPARDLRLTSDPGRARTARPLRQRAHGLFTDRTGDQREARVWVRKCPPEARCESIIHLACPVRGLLASSRTAPRIFRTDPPAPSFSLL